MDHYFRLWFLHFSVDVFSIVVANVLRSVFPVIRLKLNDVGEISKIFSWFSSVVSVFGLLISTYWSTDFAFNIPTKCLRVPIFVLGFQVI